MEGKVLKKTILIDLDGVLNQYDGHFNKDVIPPIKEGAKDFWANLSEKFEIKVFTTRNKLQTAKWIIENQIDKYISDITNVKDLSWLFIDDRCLCFGGNYKNTLEMITDFQPWYKK